jgi:hypothetical protein
MYCTEKIWTSINLKLDSWLSFTTVYLSVLGLGLLVRDPASLLHMTVVLLVLLLLLLLLVLPLPVPFLPSRQQRLCEHSHLVQIRLSPLPKDTGYKWACLSFFTPLGPRYKAVPSFFTPLGPRYKAGPSFFTPLGPRYKAVPCFFTPLGPRHYKESLLSSLPWGPGIRLSFLASLSWGPGIRPSLHSLGGRVKDRVFFFFHSFWTQV